jgi:helicase
MQDHRCHMTIHGLFVGIDRYASPDINWLACAKRDAVALHALFTDTLGGSYTLLTDDDATRQNIETAMARFATVAEDDLVIITFSGHGTDSHELLAYDTMTSRLEQTGIPLALLNTWLQRIPARRLFLILDCCFSGGMGARGISSPVKARDMGTPESRLQQIAGEGRVVFTASSADERAFEDQRLRHGLLTYYLMEALQGAEEVRTNDRIDTYHLLSHVTQRVIDASAQLGRTQNPCVRGSIDGTFMWPIFLSGDTYRAAFPDRVRQPITSAIHSLECYGFPSPLLDTWAAAIPDLNTLQIAAVNDFRILDGDHLIVSAPTSSGKTMIGELAAVHGALSRKRALFLLPLKALVADKYRHFTKLYSDYGLRVIRATGESNDQVPDLLAGRYDICLLTYEKFTALVLANPYILDSVGTVVVDEVQMIANKSRGVNLEFILTLLRMRAQRDKCPQVVALSAVIGRTNDLERWIGGRLLQRLDRPVPLDEGLISSDGVYRYRPSDAGGDVVEPRFVKRVHRKGSDQDWIIPLVQKLVVDGKQVIVFRPSKGEARGCANYLAENLTFPPAARALAKLPTGDPSELSRILRDVLQHGVAVHNADLDPDERRIVEESFNEPNSQIRVIAATTTLAMGVNTPAEAVIISGWEFPGKLPEPYSVAEYKNMVGRAGRLGFAKRGQSFIIAPDAHKEHHAWDFYICGIPEDIISRFFEGNTDVRSLIVRVLSAARTASGSGLVAMSTQDIGDFLNASFGAFLRRAANAAWNIDIRELEEGMASLIHHQLVEKTDQCKYRLTPLGWLAGHAGVEVESIVRIVDALRPLSINDLNDQTLLAAAQLTVELDETYIYVNGKGARKELITWTAELSQQGVHPHVIAQLQQSPDDYTAAARAKRAAACLLWVSDLPMNQIEPTLLRHGGRFNGTAGPVRSISNRTNDLIPTVTAVAELLHSGADFSEHLARLTRRLESGVSTLMLDIARFAGNLLSRADYHDLQNDGLTSMRVVEQADNKRLLRVLSGSAEKLEVLRQAVDAFRSEKAPPELRSPLIPLYEPA